MCTCWEFLQNSWIISFDSDIQTEELSQACGDHVQMAHRKAQSQEPNPGNRRFMFIAPFYNFVTLDHHFQSCVLAHKFILQRCRSTWESGSESSSVREEV